SQSLLTKASTSPAIGAAMPTAAWAGSARPNAAGRAAHAASSPSYAALFRVTGSPSRASLPPAISAIAKRACVPPMSAATISVIAGSGGAPVDIDRHRQLREHAADGNVG